MSDRWLAGLCGFAALSALAGGAELVSYPLGNAYVPRELLAHGPFSTFLVPGLLLGLVVGGTNAVAAALAASRRPAAVDAGLVAGGALIVWIAVEMALMRTLHPLHVLYGGLGVAIFGLAARSASGSPRRRWWTTVSLAEGVGFLAPIGVGLATYSAGWPADAQAWAVLAAGAVEGVFLGTGQAWALPVAVDRPRFVGLTALAAASAWAVGLGISALAPVAPLAAAALAAISIPAALLGMGGLQWLELGRHARGAVAWIGFTALAWTLALPWSFAPSPLVDEATPLASHLVIWACGGWMMATTMAIVTWAGARRLVPR